MNVQVAISFNYAGISGSPDDAHVLGIELSKICVSEETIEQYQRGHLVHYVLYSSDLFLLKVKYPKQYRRYVGDL